MNNIKHSEIEIEPENPFANCKLDRQKYAEALTSIINLHPSGFVLALNNKWGTGKTTFVKMWEQDLKNNNFKTVYFNAWENDFENNPLIALIGELQTLTSEADEPDFKKILEKASTLTKNILTSFIKAASSKYFGIEDIEKAIVEISKGLSDVFENEVNEYQKKKDSISDFRESLYDFITSKNGEKPLIFIVDELDRCRPNYAVSILEQIKHFFSVSNIVFILSIDKVQLGNAVKGVYGSADLDSDEYLRRFIDLEYTIPEPESDIFCKYLYEYFQFDEFFKSSKHGEISSGKFLETSELLFTNAEIPLRQQEKIFALSRLALRGVELDMYAASDVLLFLTFIKIRYNKFYESMRSKSLEIPELQEQFLKVVKNKINEKTEEQLMWLEAYLVNTYHNSLQKRDDWKPLYKIVRNPSITTPINQILLIRPVVKKGADHEYLTLLNSIDQSYDRDHLNLSYFTKRIDLLENIKM